MLLILWKYMSPLIWAANAFWFAAQTVSDAGPPLPGDTVNVSSFYGWAETLSKLTDRALWLFFLGLILGIGWVLDKRKEKALKVKEEELIELRDRDRERTESTAKLTVRALDTLERLERKLQ